MHLNNFENNSRRAPVVSRYGIVGASQPLAVAAGLKILAQGGNAADAAVAVAAGLNVTEPGNTGLGGDAFCLFFDAAHPANLRPQRVRARPGRPHPRTHPARRFRRTACRAFTPTR